MDSVRGASEEHYLASGPAKPSINFTKAREAYANAVDNAQERHAEVGILSPLGAVTFERLGKNEDYGAHRIGSVTKTFTAFLALKLVNMIGDDKKPLFPNGLDTTCGEVIAEELLEQVFEEPKTAATMTLRQLLSHTSGIDYDDHTALPTQKLEPVQTLQERFLQEATREGGRKYAHIVKPGDRIGYYSNAGLAVAGWMMEVAYNKAKKTQKSFAEIMEQEIFKGLFGCEESFIGPGPSGDIIQSPAGDMSSTASDLIKVAQRLQKGESDLANDFGIGWQDTMRAPQDIFKQQGLGCEANATGIKHAGLNREKFGTEERDVTAVLQLPLGPKQPGLVAMCDSSALGPRPQEQAFIRALEECAGISSHEENLPNPTYDLAFFCPPKGVLFRGNAYLVTNEDPFSYPDTIICSRNGMKHTLEKVASQEGVYKDENKNTWLFIKKEGGRNIIYSPLCLLTPAVSGIDIAAAQPDEQTMRSFVGVYRDAKDPKEHPTYTFKVQNGHLYMQEDNDKSSYPCLHIPDDKGGAWVVSNPNGRPLQFRFPKNPDQESLLITDIFSGAPQLPLFSRRCSKLEGPTATGLQNAAVKLPSHLAAAALADKIQKCNGSQHKINEILFKDESMKGNIPLLMEVVTLLAQRGESIKAGYAYFFIQKLMNEAERPASLLQFAKVLVDHAKETCDLRSLDLAEFHLEMVRDSKEAEERDEGKRLLDNIASYAKEIQVTGSEQEKMAAQDILDRINIYSLLYLPPSEEMRDKGITRLADVPCSTQDLALLKKEDANIQNAFELAVAYQNRVDARQIPPPGKLYVIPDAGGTITLHAKITGTRRGNEPVVILESGCGCISNDWNYVQESLGPDGPLTISYDRAGLGWSEPGKEKPTAERAVAHLEALLKTLGVSDGPFVYVGHSYGGVLAQLFALKHPKQMEGLVLVDSATDASKVGPFARDFVMEQLPPAINNGKFWQAYDEKTALGANQVVSKTKHFDAMILETDAVGPSIQLLQGTLAQTKKPPYDVPLKVIGAGIYDSADSAFAASQEPLIERSTSAKYVLAQTALIWSCTMSQKLLRGKSVRFFRIEDNLSSQNNSLQ